MRSIKINYDYFSNFFTNHYTLRPARVNVIYDVSPLDIISYRKPFRLCPSCNYSQANKWFQIVQHPISWRLPQSYWAMHPTQLKTLYRSLLCRTSAWKSPLLKCWSQPRHIITLISPQYNYLKALTDFFNLIQKINPFTKNENLSITLTFSVEINLMLQTQMDKCFNKVMLADLLYRKLPPKLTVGKRQKQYQYYFLFYLFLFYIAVCNIYFIDIKKVIIRCNLCFSSLFQYSEHFPLSFNSSKNVRLCF